MFIIHRSTALIFTVLMAGLAACSGSSTEDANPSGGDAALADSGSSDTSAPAPDSSTDSGAAAADSGASDAGPADVASDDKGPGPDASTADSGPDAGSGSSNLTGFWYMYSEPATFTAFSEPWDETAGNAGVDEQMIRLTQTGDKVEVSAACDPEQKLGAGNLISGKLRLMDPGMKTAISNELSVEANIIEGTVDRNGTSYLLLLARIQDLKCTDDKGAPVKTPPAQPLVFIDELFSSEPETLKPEELANASSGMKNLEAAAAAGLPAAGDDFTVSNSTETCMDTGGKNIPCPEPGKGAADTVLLTSSNQTVQTTKELRNRPVLDNWPELFPGALLQGRELTKGAFKPVSIARAGAKFTLEITGGKKQDFEVAEAAPQTVADGVNKAVLAAGSQNLRTSWRVFQTWPGPHLAFAAGLDDRFNGADLKRLELDASTRKNQWVLQITQHAYSVTMEEPRFRYSVFKAGKNFEDPNNEIGAGNPPLYVSRVNYGRNIFVLAKNSLDANANQAMLEALFNGKEIELPGGLTLKDAVTQTEWSFSGRGIDNTVFDKARNAPAAQKYDEIRSLLASMNSGAFRGRTEAHPIQFTLEYLQNRNVASMAFQTTYKSTTSSWLTRVPMVIRADDFLLKITYVDDDLWVYDITDGTERHLKTFSKTEDWTSISSWIPQDRDVTTLRFRLGNGGCWKTGTTFEFAITGEFGQGPYSSELTKRNYEERTPIKEFKYIGYTLSDCGWQYETDVEFRRKYKFRPGIGKSDFFPIYTLRENLIREPYGYNVSRDWYYLYTGN
ncbi:MAG: hypothetical protein GMKNLPBB_01584 [Myxococcota bacterium]|nr:hypothetical protein [Myxococcota bacterium]